MSDEQVLRLVPTGFDQANCVLRADDEGAGGVESTFAFQGETEDGCPVVITCHRLTAAALEEITRTGRVWVSMVSRGAVPPLAVLGRSPFDPPPEP